MSLTLPTLIQVAALMGGTGACSANAVLFPRRPVVRW
jgi:hypothetical protein